MRNHLILAALALPLLAGCEALSSANQYSGINHAEATFSDEGRIQSIVFYGGKESGTTDLTVDLGNGVMASFRGTDIKAFEGQAVRAAVEQAFAEAGKEIIPEVVEAIVDAVVGL